MKRERRKFADAEKVRILRLHLIDKKPVSDICDKYNLNPTIFYRWQKQFFENGAAAFKSSSNNVQRKESGKIKKLEEKLVQKDAIISEIMSDHIKLKKSFGED